MNANDIRKILRRYPTLSEHGMNLSHPWNLPEVYSFTDQQRADELAQSRAALSRSVELCSAVVAWLRHLEPVRTPSVTSYTLKHACQASIKYYTPTGALIVGVIYCGIPFQYRAGPNIDIGVSLRSLRAWPAMALLGDFERKPIVFGPPPASPVTRKPIRPLPITIPVVGISGASCRL